MSAAFLFFTAIATCHATLGQEAVWRSRQSARHTISHHLSIIKEESAEEEEGK